MLEEPSAIRYVRVAGSTGAWGSPLALSGVRVFGEREGAPPAAPEVTAIRLDGRTARIAWTSVLDADGVDVRYGRSLDKLYHSWLVRGRDDLVLSTLNAGEDYWVAVDSFNGSGLTPGQPLRITSGLGGDPGSDGFDRSREDGDPG